MSIDKFIADHKELKRRVDELKRQGRKIVFTNGCFDILHVGHIRCLREAKKLGDVLIVALNSDASVKKVKKNANLPVFPEDERAEVISAVQYVDYVTLFSEEDVSRLLLLLKPHIHAKGTDYTCETVPERETVLSYGGKVAIV